MVLTVADRYLIAQFEDRADTTKVEFVPDWLSYLTDNAAECSSSRDAG